MPVRQPWNQMRNNPKTLISALPPEVSLLLLCLRSKDQSELRSQLNAVSVEQWQTILKLAGHYGVAPILHHRLEYYDVALPDEIARALKQAYLWNTAHNLRIDHELTRILHLMQAHNIPVILLKGVYLASFIYADLGLRTMADIDLLIPEADIEKSINALQSLNFVATRPFWPAVDLALHHAPPLTKENLIVELHWRLTHETNLPGIDHAGIWARSEPIQINHTQAAALCLSDLIFHLIVHASYHHQFHNQLRTLVDLAEVLQKHQPDLDWSEIVQLIRTCRAERGAYIMLRLAADLLDAQIPSGVFQELCPSGWADTVLGWAQFQLFQLDPVLSENYIRVFHGAGFADKLAALRRGLFPSRTVMAAIYALPPESKKLIWLYPRHIISRLSKYFKPAWRLLLGDRRQSLESKSDQSLRDWLHTA